ncbi:MAG: ArsR family transcriptional regulator [Chloroflexota bacterium]|nr:MAG: ArsR family transcriptional regulator [Chloroflexota bacterium]
MSTALALSRPPAFLKLLSHPLRWQILKILAGTDLKVQELVRLLNQPQNLVSYHLHQLRQQRIIHERRSIADGREIYYSIDLDQVRLLYFSSGEALHPALGERELPTPTIPNKPVRVLFLCTHNSARSQIAEAILRTRSQGKIDAFSAGTEPTEVHPLAIQAMAEMAIDIQDHRSKSLEEYIGQDFDYIITVCDRAREACPIFPGDPVRIHWSFPDPAATEGSESERYRAFRETAIQLNTRIGYLLLTLNRSEA